MRWTNFHSHTHYCDGEHEVIDYIKHAIHENMPAYGISSHAPVSFQTDWCIPDDQFNSYLQDVRIAKDKFKDKIEVYLGLEIDYIPKVAGRDRHIVKGIELDYFIGSVHFVDTFEDGTHWNIDHTRELFLDGLKKIFSNNFLRASERFYELTHQMIEKDTPDIIGHLDKIKMYNGNNELFDEKNKQYRDQVENILQVIKKSDTIVEVNTRGYYRYGQVDLYPSGWILERIRKLDIPLMLNSDAHNPDEISLGFSYAASILKEIGITKLYSMHGGKWRSFDFDENGLIC